MVLHDCPTFCKAWRQGPAVRAATVMQRRLGPAVSSSRTPLPDRGLAPSAPQAALWQVAGFIAPPLSQQPRTRTNDRCNSNRLRTGTALRRQAQVRLDILLVKVQLTRARTINHVEVCITALCFLEPPTASRPRLGVAV